MQPTYSESTTTEPQAEDSPTNHRHHFLTLPVILAIGFILYEATHSPGIAAVAMCLKFGWEDFRTARWLRRQDGDWTRGRACFWLYVASGLWKTAIMAVLMVFLVVLLDYLQQANNPPKNLAKANQGPPPMFVGAMLTAFFCFGFSTAATYTAVLHAWRGKVRLWLSGAVHVARSYQEWPPVYGRYNWVGLLLLTTVIITCLVLAPIGLALLFGFFDAIQFPLNKKVKALCIVIVVLMLLPAAIVIFRNHLTDRFAADTPEECWGADSTPDPILPPKEEAI